MRLFLAFAFAYFFSALLRAVTATLAPVFSAELALGAADLGLLAGAFFFGFAAMQLPLGWALDRYGPRRTLLWLMAVAVCGCAAFALAPNLLALIVARALIGAGLGACLMAALTSYRRWYTPMTQLRANSWMLMTGSLGMLASTLPVQWLLPSLGWRGLFWCLGGLIVLAMGLVLWAVPQDSPAAPPGFDVPRNPDQASPSQARLGAGSHSHQPLASRAPAGAYRVIASHPVFVALAPLAFFTYGGMIAIQSLWAGPWLTRVSGWTAAQAAQGLFSINLAMLFAFMAWGALMPQLTRRGWTALRLMSWGCRCRCWCWPSSSAWGGAPRRRTGRCGAWAAPSCRSASHWWVRHFRLRGLVVRFRPTTSSSLAVCFACSGASVWPSTACRHWAFSRLRLFASRWPLMASVVLPPISGSSGANRACR